MDSIVNIILSGITYDLIKKGTELTFNNVFGRLHGKRINENINIYNNFLDEINNEKDLNNKERVMQDILSNKESYTNIFENDLYNTNFAKRLDYIIFLINKSRKNSKKINLEYLGEFLGLSSVNPLLKYYKCDEEPSYNFCESVAEKLGVNTEWLKNGNINEAVFGTSLPTIYEPEKLLENINQRDDKIHFVINEDENNRRIIVVKKYNELKYEYYPYEYVFNSSVGASGMSQLVSLYKFLYKFRINEGNIDNVHIVTQETFDGILMGNIYCGVIEQYMPIKFRNILDDFLDICYKHFTTREYKELYGDDFLKIQEIVMAELKREN